MRSYFDHAWGWMRRHAVFIVSLSLLQLICYTYFFTVPLLSNHTFPNVWLYNYPSWKTNSEGRWFADLIILLQGSSGVQSFQFSCAIILQAINGLLLSEILGIRATGSRFLLGGILCLYPLFPDYYSFACDHLTFVLGDTLSLVAALFWINCTHRGFRILIPGVLYLLSIASYGPKISLVLLLCSISSLISIQKSKNHFELQVSKSIWREFSQAFYVLFLAIFGFWATAKITITTSYDSGRHTHLSSVNEMLHASMKAYSKVAEYYHHDMGAFPPWLGWFPIGIICAGAACILIKTKLYGIRAFLYTLLILAMVPLMLYSPWIINSQSYIKCSRIGAVYGYGFVVFLGFFISVVTPRWIGSVVSIVVLYFFTILATQQNNAACLKSVYESNIINRIIQRCDTVIQVDGKDVPIVVIGMYPSFETGKYIKYPPAYSVHQVKSCAFAPYRQVEILNFFEGKNTFRRPSTDEVRMALISTDGRKPWPDPQGVYMSGKTLVVLLQQNTPGIMTTWDQSM